MMIGYIICRGGDFDNLNGFRIKFQASRQSKLSEIYIAQISVVYFTELLMIFRCLKCFA